MDEWIKCYSKSRKREYYFNQTTGRSVWSVEELTIINKTVAAASAAKSAESPLGLNKKTSKVKFKAKDKLKSSSCSSSPATSSKLSKAIISSNKSVIIEKSKNK